MASIEIKNRKGDVVGDLAAWKRLASPASKNQWKKGRSAAELARSWLSDHGPAALARVLGGQDATSGFEIESAVAEAQTSFDEFSGPRNHDLLLVGSARGGRTVVAIEGKADETFGQKLSGYTSAARRKIQNGENTNAPERLRRLTQALAGWEVADNASRLELRYQLFSAVAGTLAAAHEHEADQAVFCVHELVTSQTSEKDRKRNDEDIRRFLDRVFGAYAPTEDSWLVGPVHARIGSEKISRGIPLYIAKVSTEAAPS